MGDSMLITTQSDQASAALSENDRFRWDVLHSGEGGGRPVVYDDGHFRIVPSVGPLHRDHLLICALRSRTGIHQMSDSELERLQRVVDATQRVFRRLHGRKFIMFENGTGAHGEGGCSIREFHIHVVPTPRAFQHLGTFERGFHAVENLVNARKHARLLGDYQMVWCPEQKPAIRSRRRFPSQYLRRRFAELNGVAEWDWRKVGTAVDWQAYSDAYAALRAAFVRDKLSNVTH